MACLEPVVLSLLNMKQPMKRKHFNNDTVHRNMLQSTYLVDEIADIYIMKALFIFRLTDV